MKPVVEAAHGDERQQNQAMDEIEAARAYWTAVGQLAGVFAIPLVLEARRSAARWRQTNRSYRRVQSTFYVLAGIAIYDAVSTSLFTLLEPRYDTVGMLARAITLTGVAFGLVLNPVLTFFYESNRDYFIIMQRALPWSNFRKLRRAARRNEHVFVEWSVTVIRALDTLDTFEEELLALKGQNDRNHAILAQLADSLNGALKGATPDQLPEGVSKEQIEHHLLGQLESVRQLPSYMSQISIQLESIRKFRVQLLDEVLDVDQKAQAFDDTRQIFKITHLDPELRTALESNVARVADDAADNLTSPSYLQTPATLSPVSAAINAIDAIWGEGLRAVVNADRTDEERPKV
jgi:hypothetical protein